MEWESHGLLPRDERARHTAAPSAIHLSLQVHRDESMIAAQAMTRELFAVNYRAKLRSASLLALTIINLLLLTFSVRINSDQGVTPDEGRYVPAGVYHWRTGEFAIANDSPPLARMVTALALLPHGVNLGNYELAVKGPDGGPCARARELVYAGRFTTVEQNYYWYRLFCIARMTGFVWWALGAWIVFRWSKELYGRMAGFLALGLWYISPNVLAQEQLATPELSAAVLCAAATYAFQRYLASPSWDRILLSGFLLGVAQLADFVSLILLVAWPLLALLHHLTRVSGVAPAIAPRVRFLQVTAAVALSVWVVNLGYGFSGTGSALGSFDFCSDALSDHSRPGVDVAARAAGGNRFRGSWLGRAIIPLPADYVKGLNRRAHERKTASESRGEQQGAVKVAPHSLAAAGVEAPIGIWGLMLWSLVSMARRRPRGDTLAGELTPWIPVSTILFLTTRAFGPISPQVGNLLTLPFGFIIASSLACRPRLGGRITGSVAASLLFLTVGQSLATIYAYQFTHEHITKFRRDIEHVRWNFGRPDHDAGSTVVVDTAVRGLLYRKFVDSRGDEINYALYLPRGYRGDRPYPMILFLHGFGDRGTRGTQFTWIGLPFVIGHRDIDFLVLCPQGHSGNWEPTGDDARRAMELLAAVQMEYQVDPKRISLTGVSSGGNGVWHLAAAYPDRWAAIVPVAASGYPDMAPAIKHIPSWCFHNRYDAGPPVESPRKMIEALKAAGGQPKYTEFLEINHNAWDWAYTMPELYDWLARQSLP
jgi:pimeloyl-ACP methyl ester carboxylesterase